MTVLLGNARGVVEAVEPGLARIRELLHDFDSATPADQLERLQSTHTLLRACSRYVLLHREPTPRTYTPARILKPVLAEDNERTIVSTNAATDCYGDPDLVLAAVQLLCGNVRLDLDAVILLELFEDKDTPQLVLRIDGPGTFLDPPAFADFLDISTQQLALCWTAATRGGRLDWSPQQVACRFRGVRVIPESVQGLQAVFESLERLEARTSQWFKLALTSPSEATQMSQELRFELAKVVDEILAEIDQNYRQPEPASFCALLEEAAGRAEGAYKSKGFAIETFCDQAVPPLSMRRDRMQLALDRVFAYGLRVLATGGSLSVLADYDVSRREACAVMSYNGCRCIETCLPIEASIRRAIVDGHAGEYLSEVTAQAVIIELRLPDPVGCALDRWIPGWEGFGDRSRQVLRLLMSGGPTPPAELLLAGILEEELERWLLPVLELPVASNTAHDLPDRGPTAPGGSLERRAKALGQIRRRKPRKEIAQPAYAAEVLWAFHGDSRGRHALGLDGFGTEQIEALCRSLVQKPPVFLDALVLIAKRLGP